MDSIGRSGRPRGRSAVCVATVLACLGACSSHSGSGPGRGTAAVTAPVTAPATAPRGSGTPSTLGTTGTHPAPTLSPVPRRVQRTAAAVPLTASVAVGGGVTVRIARAKSITAKATAPGDIGGPAVEVQVRLGNAGATPLALGSVTTTCTYGSTGTPCPALTLAQSVPFTGSLAPAGSRTGVFTFGLPRSQRSSVSFMVTIDAKHPVAVFRGTLR